MNVAAETPLWPSELTAWGTLAVAVVAVAVALFAEWRTGKRLAAQQEKHDQEIAEERRLADERLAKQLAHSDAQLADERAHSAAQLQDERQRLQDQEQWAQAYLVQVTPARQNVAPNPDRPRDAEPVERAVAIVVNHGRYTITRVQAQLCMHSNSQTGYERTEHLSSWFNLRDEIREGIWEARSNRLNATLTPMDLGLKYTSVVVAQKFLVDAYPVVRWQDRWGTWWEHKQGVVRQIKESERWAP